MLASQELLPVQTEYETPYVAPVPPQTSRVSTMINSMHKADCHMHVVLTAQVHYAIVHMICEKAY